MASPSRPSSARWVKPTDVHDLLVFEDGQFISEECERRCGYSKVEYWVRGDEIEGSFIWVNKRWHWTFEKEFWFKRRLVEGDNPSPGRPCRPGDI